MLKEFLNAITSSIQNTAYTYPGNGVNIPPQATFGRMLNNLLGAFTNNPANTFGQAPSGGQIQNYNPAVQAYTNSLSGGQNFFGGVSQKSPKREAFSPGAVVTS